MREAQRLAEELNVGDQIRALTLAQRDVRE